MSSDLNIPDELKTWIESKSQEMVSHPFPGYYPADTVIDAFEKGQQLYEERIKLEIETKVKAMNDSVHSCLKQMSEFGYEVFELYLSFNFVEVKALLLVNEDEHLSDEFIDRMYPMISKIEVEFRKENNLVLDISFLDDSKNLDRIQLKNDDFFGINLKTGEKIFQ